MKQVPRFKAGSLVWVVDYKRFRRSKKPCTLCEGATCLLTTKGKIKSCPLCFGYHVLYDERVDVPYLRQAKVLSINHSGSLPPQECDINYEIEDLDGETEMYYSCAVFETRRKGFKSCLAELNEVYLDFLR
jgi:hypothetical protein